MGTGPATPSAFYPGSAAARDRFVVDRRQPTPRHDPWRYQDVIVEDERTADGHVARTATVFLTGRECPWRCVMCDLWRYTVPEDTPRGAIPAQVGAARDRLRRERPPVTQIKLYNAGSFFDPRAVPEGDYADIAGALAGFAHVVVESHPALVGDRVDRWLEALAARGAQSLHGRSPQLEVAMGLETVHPDALEQLHKRMTVDQFADAADALRRRGVLVRVFLLIAPPFVPADEQLEWLLRSVDAAFDCGASVVTLIPTRTGNGALDALSADGLFRQPTLDDVERGVDAAFARARGRGRLFVDVWDLERFAECPACLDARRDRLHRMNLEQRILPSILCTQQHVRSVRL
jgi:archaeosine synthase beta-subunit